VKVSAMYVGRSTMYNNDNFRTYTMLLKLQSLKVLNKYADIFSKRVFLCDFMYCVLLEIHLRLIWIWQQGSGHQTFYSYIKWI